MDQKKVQDDDRVFQSASPLNMAASRGDSDLVKALTKERAEATDHRRRSALHLASAKDYTDIVSRLVPEDDPDIYTARDVDGRNPLHLAAIYGRVEVLELLVQRCPYAAEARADRGETILHLCLKYNHKEELILLLQNAKLEEVVNTEDDDGNTLLHLAVTIVLNQVVKRLLDCSSIDVNSTNYKGKTSLDVAVELERKSHQKPETTGRAKTFAKLQVETLLKQGAKRGEELRNMGWLTSKREALMVVASLMATIAFQAGVSPPGGVWQDSSDGHIAGEAVMAYNYPDSYPYYLRSNTIAFVGSLTTILLLIKESPLKNKLFMWLLVVIMWLTVATMTLGYLIAISVVTPKKDGESLSSAIKFGVLVWSLLMIIYSAVSIIQYLTNVINGKRLQMGMSNRNLFRFS